MLMCVAVNILSCKLFCLEYDLIFVILLYYLLEFVTKIGCEFCVGNIVCF
jgi:hypothetical protein